jgi:hypothetical protein
VNEERLRAAILELTADRRSICPSDAARAVGGEGWRDLMDQAREVARTLANDGEVVITQRGHELDPNATWRGPIRIRAR